MRIRLAIALYGNVNDGHLLAEEEGSDWRTDITMHYAQTSRSERRYDTSISIRGRRAAFIRRPR